MPCVASTNISYSLLFLDSNFLTLSKVFLISWFSASKLIERLSDRSHKPFPTQINTNAKNSSPKFVLIILFAASVTKRHRTYEWTAADRSRCFDLIAQTGFATRLSNVSIHALWLTPGSYSIDRVDHLENNRPIPYL